MILALLMTKSSKQFAFTPESEEEKAILDLLPKGEECLCEITTGPFYIAGNDNVINHAMSDTTMLVFETVEKKGKSKR
ncbi:hypothetical protein LCGC14_2636040 [marine sediment metagenome]|uniref:Uncharacterized protein n=1 Tax=marine sediment metagenome TaxID=412755 RepID=A0A0F9C9R3_9ZZZZ